MLTKRVKLRLDWKDILLIVLELLTSFSVEIKRKCYQNSNIFKNFVATAQISIWPIISC